MGLKDSDPCLKKAHPEEPIFVLMARDKMAPYTIIEWIKSSLETQPAERLHEALDCAIRMVSTQPQWREYADQQKQAQPGDAHEAQLSG